MSNVDSTLQLSGLLHKKRGGFGKIMPNSWQYRYFTVSKVILIFIIIIIYYT